MQVARLKSARAQTDREIMQLTEARRQLRSKRNEVTLTNLLPNEILVQIFYIVVLAREKFVSCRSSPVKKRWGPIRFTQPHTMWTGEIRLRVWSNSTEYDRLRFYQFLSGTLR
jgi:hypothetical protein